MHTKAISKSFHGWLYILSMLHFFYTIKLQHNAFKDTAAMLAKLGMLIEGRK